MCSGNRLHTLGAKRFGLAPQAGRTRAIHCSVDGRAMTKEFARIWYCYPGRAARNRDGLDSRQTEARSTKDEYASQYGICADDTTCRRTQQQFEPSLKSLVCRNLQGTQTCDPPMSRQLSGWIGTPSANAHWHGGGWFRIGRRI